MSSITFVQRAGTTGLFIAFIGVCAACGFDHPNWLTSDGVDAAVPESDSGTPGPGVDDSGVGVGGRGGSGGAGGSGGRGAVGGAGGGGGTDTGPARGFTVGLWTTGGGGRVVSSDHQLHIVVGEPQPMGVLQSADHAVRFGAMSLVGQSIP